MRTYTKEDKKRTYQDKETGKTWDLMDEKLLDVLSAMGSAVYLLFMLLLLLWQLLGLGRGQGWLFDLVDEPAGPLQSGTFQLALYSFIGGALGGTVNGIRSVMIWYCEQRAFGRRFVWKYITSSLGWRRAGSLCLRADSRGHCCLSRHH